MAVKDHSVDTTITGGAGKVQFWRRKDYVNMVGPNSNTLWMALDGFLHRKNFGTVKQFIMSGFIPIIVLIINQI